MGVGVGVRVGVNVGADVSVGLIVEVNVGLAVSVGMANDFERGCFRRVAVDNCVAVGEGFNFNILGKAVSTTVIVAMRRITAKII